MSRTIFPNLQLFKKEVTERLLIAIREIYKNHPTYLYNDDEALTQILIYPSYADVERPGNMPKILVRPGGYEFGMNDTLFGTFESEARNADGALAGFTYSKMVATSFQAVIYAYAEEESSDIADEFALLVVFACRTMFDQVGIKVENTQVSETSVVDPDKGKYQTIVAVAIDFPWSGSIITGDPPLDDIQFDPPDLSAEAVDGYRAPGIEVFREKLKQLNL